MKKGISTIIAVILMLIITIALIGTAYMFIYGMMGARISQAISAEISCFNERLIIIVYNQGTDMINNTNGKGELKIYINNFDRTDFFEENGESGDKTYGIVPHENIVLISNSSDYSGKQSTMVMTSSNSQTGEVFC